MRTKKYSTEKDGEFHEEKPRKKKLYKKRTSFKKLKLVFYLIFRRPKPSQRKGPGDLILEFLPIPECVKNSSFFVLRLVKMWAMRTNKETEPTNEELSKIEKEFTYLSVA
ncbi:MAG TPA: hypothetical protein PK886_01685 [Candidatus Paceibacterota bacterium]|nr:hypothetical protein [Candidatus Paceibacterota bacterium]